MLTKNSSENQVLLLNESAFSAVSRRKFLGFIGAGSAILATAAVASSCKKDDMNPVPSGGVDLGSGDVGVLNYAYALEQLEAAFYVKVALSFYSGITATEQAFLTDIRDHEVAHRNFFKAAIQLLVLHQSRTWK